MSLRNMFRDYSLVHRTPGRESPSSLTELLCVKSQCTKPKRMTEGLNVYYAEVRLSDKGVKKVNILSLLL